jgi:two-component system NarL family response regulator
MAETRALTLIVARPGPLREGVEALLASVPQVEVIATVGQASAAFSVAVAQPLDLLLLDAGLPDDEGCRLLRLCRRQRAGLRCIALADNAAQEQAARSAGADAVFLKGFPADKFAETVEVLLAG